MFSPRRPHLSRPRRAAALAALLLALFCAPLRAQWIDTTLPPIRPTYGIGDDEFAIVGQITKWTGSRGDPEDMLNNQDVWDFAHRIGVNILAQNYSVGDWSHLGRHFMAISHRNAALMYADQPWGRDRIVATFRKGRSFQGGFGRELQFFPFDSLQSPYWHWWLDTIQGGVQEYNHTEFVPGHSDWELAERHYTSANTTPGQTVLSGIRYANPDDPFDNRTFFGADLLELRQNANNNARSFAFVFTGHLVEPLNSTNLDTATVFRMEVWHNIDSGRKYLKNNPTDVRTAGSDTAIFVRSFPVTRGQLNAGYPDTVRAKFRTIDTVIDLRTRADGGPGPLHLSWPVHADNNTNRDRKVDVRVIWTGAENAAIRSVAIRDSLGHLMLGNCDSCLHYRGSLANELKLQLRNGSTIDDTTQFRWEVIRIQSGTEAFHNPTEFAGFNAVNKLVGSTFNLNYYRSQRGQPLRQGDSLRAFMWELGGPVFHQSGTQDESYYYFYLNDARDTVNAWIPRGQRPPGYDNILLDSARTYQALFETPYHQIPTLRQHNGGRFHLPVLDTTLASVEDYTTTVQRGFMGYFHPGPLNSWPYKLVPGHIDNMGEMATVLRREGRRFIPHIGLVTHLQLRDSLNRIGPAVDTIKSHTPEPAELRMMTNLTLAYGAHGIEWWNFETQRELLYQRDSASGTPWIMKGAAADSYCCLGAVEYFTWETDRNVADFGLWSTAKDYGATTADSNAYIPGYWGAWANTTGEVATIDTFWLRRIGPHLVKLRWRDAYSVHHTVEWPHAAGATFRDTLYRPLPANEIVTKVVSRSVRSSTPDPAHRTFVELGLFETKPGVHPTTGAREPMLDTNFLMVVNRRSFERSPEISATSPEGRKMDTLAESRTILLRFNLFNPIEDSPLYRQYSFIRVREVAPDTTRLPLASVARRPLDTLIYADSVALLDLRPGGAALLEITFCRPDSSIDSGDVRFGGQHRMIFDGKRYHVTYWRRDATVPPGAFFDRVYYRRSEYMSDMTGPIQWEPMEWALSNAIEPGDTLRQANAFPAMTMRTRANAGGTQDSVLTVVWGCHPPQSYSLADEREIVLRNIYNNPFGTPQFGPLESIVRHKGVDSTQWGIPVISRLVGGEAIAWGDSLSGINARIRRTGAGAQWWRNNTGYSAVLDSIGPVATFGPGTYPSVPTFAHVAGADSNCALVWQQPYGPGGNAIFYARLIDSGGVLAPTLYSPMPISVAGPNYHPSTDQVQDPERKLKEGVAWESFELGDDNLTHDWLNYRSVTTPLTMVGGDILGTPTLSATVRHAVFGNPVLLDSAYPNVTSLNNALTKNDVPILSVVCQTEHKALYNARVQFGKETLKGILPYAYSGRFPNGSTSIVPQGSREAIVYQSYRLTPTRWVTIRTSRQFFAKTRPAGYVAEGREATLRLRDSVSATAYVRLHDVWMAGDNVAAPLPMVARESGRVDDLARAGDLFRTAGFTANDSTEIGYELHAGYRGDTSALGSARFSFVVELVDSASGAAVAVLDSFAIDRPTKELHRIARPTLDLLSGTYWVRLRIDTAGWTPVAVATDDNVPVAEVSSWVPSLPSPKLSREGAVTGAEARITAWPNPTTGATELRFSVPVAGPVSVTVYDGLGREVARPIDGAEMEAGRWAVELDARDLPGGTYLVVLETAFGRVAEKLVIMR